MTEILVWSAVLLLSPTSPEAAKKAFQLAPKLSRGQILEFQVKKSSSAWGDNRWGDFESEEESEVSYTIEVTEVQENEDLVLKVTLACVKARGSEGGPTAQVVWEFDSSKQPGEEARYRSTSPILERLRARRALETGKLDHPGSALREFLQSTATVVCAGGKIAALGGLPAPRLSTGDPLRFRAAVSAAELRRDLEVIFSSTIAGKDLQVGKEYQPSREALLGASAISERFRWIQHAPEHYKLEGEETVGGKKAAKFALTLPPRESPLRASQPITEESACAGTALASMEDGVLIRLALQSESTLTNVQNGYCNSLSRTVEIQRVR